MIFRHLLGTVALLIAVACGAQQVGYIDLASMPDYKFLNREENRGTYGGSSPSSSGRLERPFEVSLVSLDQRSVPVGGDLSFTIRVRNVSNKTIAIPFDPNPADIEPPDPNQRYRYQSAHFFLIFRLKTLTKYSLTVDPRPLYGANSVPGTYRVLQPGQWITVRNSGRVACMEQLQRELETAGSFDAAVLPAFEIFDEVYTPHDPQWHDEPSLFSEDERAEAGDPAELTVLPPAPPRRRFPQSR